MVCLPRIFPRQVLERRALRARDPFVKLEREDFELFLSRIVVCKLIIAPPALEVQKPDRAVSIVGSKRAERCDISRTGSILMGGASSIGCRCGAGNGRHLVPVRRLDGIPDVPFVSVVVDETGRAKDVVAVVVVMNSRSGIHRMAPLRTI